MRKNYIAVLIGTLAITGIAAASGRPLDATPTGMSIRGGVAFPIDGTYSRGQSSLLNIGLEFELPTPLLAGGDTFIALDYQTKGFSGNRGSVFPLTINQRFYGKGRSEGNRTFGFLGVGVAFVDYTSSNTVLCARGGFGAELSTNVFVETEVTIAELADGLRPNSIGVSFGYRF